MSNVPCFQERRRKQEEMEKQKIAESVRKAQVSPIFLPRLGSSGVFKRPLFG